jgi:hypothetical protein
LNLSSKIDGLLEVILEVADCGNFPPPPVFAELALILLDSEGSGKLSSEGSAITNQHLFTKWPEATWEKGDASNRGANLQTTHTGQKQAARLIVDELNIPDAAKFSR